MDAFILKTDGNELLALAKTIALREKIILGFGKVFEATL
jgi:hypothetical protein